MLILCRRGGKRRGKRGKGERVWKIICERAHVRAFRCKAAITTAWEQGSPEAGKQPLQCAELWRKCRSRVEDGRSSAVQNVKASKALGNNFISKSNWSFLFWREKPQYGTTNSKSSSMFPTLFRKRILLSNKQHDATATQKSQIRDAMGSTSMLLSVRKKKKGTLMTRSDDQRQGILTYI